MSMVTEKTKTAKENEEKPLYRLRGDCDYRSPGKLHRPYSQWWPRRRILRKRLSTRWVPPTRRSWQHLCSAGPRGPVPQTVNGQRRQPLSYNPRRKEHQVHPRIRICKRRSHRKWKDPQRKVQERTHHCHWWSQRSWNSVPRLWQRHASPPEVLRKPRPRHCRKMALHHQQRWESRYLPSWTSKMGNCSNWAQHSYQKRRQGGLTGDLPELSR